jgi:hypothetical protein
VTPRSSLVTTVGPKCSLVMAANTRGDDPDVSIATAWTSVIGNIGWDNSQLPGRPGSSRAIGLFAYRSLARRPLRASVCVFQITGEDTPGYRQL